VSDIVSLRRTVEYWAGYEDSRAHHQKVIDALVAAIDVERVSDLLTQIDQLQSLVDILGKRLDGSSQHHREIHSLCLSKGEVK